MGTVHIYTQNMIILLYIMINYKENGKAKKNNQQNKPCYL